MWKKNNNKLIKKFEFKNFIEAFSFITKVAIVSETLNHHPTIINEYNRVEIQLCTHDKNDTITKKDYKLAVAIDKL